MSERKRDRESEGIEDSVFQERRDERRMDNADIMMTSTSMIIEKINSAKDDTERLIQKAKEETIRAFKEDLAIVNSTLHDLKIENETLKKNYETLTKESKRQKDEIESLKGVVRLQSFEISEMQMYSRRDSLKVYNLMGQGGPGSGATETSEQTAQTVRNFFRNRLGVNVQKSDISIAHRLQASDGDRERAIQVKFTRREAKMDVLRNRRKCKGTGVVIAEDLCSSYLRLFHNLRDLVGKGNVWTWEGKVLCKVGGITKRVTLENADDIINEIKECDRGGGGPPHSQDSRGERSPRGDRGDRDDRSSSHGQQGRDSQRDMDIDPGRASRDRSPDRQRSQNSATSYSNVVRRDLERPAPRARSLSVGRDRPRQRQDYRPFNEQYNHRYRDDYYQQNTRDDRGRWGDWRGKGRGTGKRGRGRGREHRGYEGDTFMFNPQDY